MEITSLPICSIRSFNFRRMLSIDRKSTRLNSSHLGISYAVFCLKKKNYREGAACGAIEEQYPQDIAHLNLCGRDRFHPKLHKRHMASVAGGTGLHLSMHMLTQHS